MELAGGFGQRAARRDGERVHRCGLGCAFRNGGSDSQRGNIDRSGFSEFRDDLLRWKGFQLERTANGYDVEVVAAPEPAMFPLLLTLAGFAVIGSRRGAGRRKRLSDVGSNPA